MKFSQKEIFDIIKAWLAISVAFGIILGGGLAAGGDFLTSFVVASLTVGVGFIFHELAHKFASLHYGHHAEFRSFDFMLLLAIAMSFFGFVIAAPGAVMIQEREINEKESGIISAAGIAASLTAALLFFLLTFVAGEGLLGMIARYGAIVNSWLAIFNLIPVSVLDGAKVFRWSKLAFLGLAATGIALLFLSAA